MNLSQLFKLLVAGWRRRRVEPKPAAQSVVPALDEDDVHFITSEHVLGKWGDVEFYGPGAAEAYARRAKRLGIEVEAQDVLKKLTIKPAKARRHRLSKRERTERKLAKLTAEIEAMKK